MSSTDTSEDHALAESGPLHTLGQLDFDQTLQRSIATYRYENALVKTELAAALERHAREISELKLKCQAQVKEVEQQRGETEKRLREVQEKYTDENRRLQQVNLHLQQRIKATEEDVEAMTKERDSAAKEKAQTEEHWQQRLLTSQTSLQAVKEEKNRLMDNMERLRAELDKERVTVRELTTTLNSERHQQQLIKSRLSELEQHCKIQLTAAQAEATQLRRKNEIESSEASKQMKDLLSTLEEEKALLARTKERANARELESEKKLAEQKQSMLAKSQDLIRQNSALQDHIKDLETKINNFEVNKEAKLSELEAREHNALEKLHEVEREKAILEGRISALENLEALLRKEREDSSTLRQKLQQQQADAEELERLNAELRQHKRQLENKLNETQAQQESLKNDMQKQLDTGQRIVVEQRTSHQEELEQLRSRIATLQASFNDRNKSYLEECSLLKQKVRTYAKLIKKLRYKLEIGEVQVEQLEAQHAVLKDNVPSHVYRRLQSQLQDITRKHNEFAAFIRGLSEFQSALPEIAELTNRVGVVDQKIRELEEDQLHCLSELESL